MSLLQTGDTTDTFIVVMLNASAPTFQFKICEQLRIKEVLLRAEGIIIAVYIIL